MFVSKGRIFPKGEKMKGAPLGQVLGLTRKHLTRLERLVRNKHSSLLGILVNYGRKKVLDYILVDNVVIFIIFCPIS
jgi:hypothetical protein